MLEDARDNDEWHWRNWLGCVRGQHYVKVPAAMPALGEAWGWLQSQGLITIHPNQDHEEAFSISRKGHAALAQGLPWVRAVDRLNVDPTANQRAGRINTGITVGSNVAGIVGAGVAILALVLGR